jgi:hypothetical protein
MRVPHWWQVACVAATLNLAPSVMAARLFVDQANGSDAYEGLSWASAKATVGAALTLAEATPEPDIVSVGAGTYLERVSLRSPTSLLGGFRPGGGRRDPVAYPTILDSGGEFRVMYLGPGTDGVVIDGFVLRGAAAWADRARGGGILVYDAAPLIRRNTIESSNACLGGGVAIVYTAARASYARLEGNWIRRNSGPPRDCSILTGLPYPGPICTGVYVTAPSGVDVGVILSGNLIEDNFASLGAGGVCLWAAGGMEHDIVRNNAGGGLDLDGGPFDVFNVAVLGNESSGVWLQCDQGYRLDHLTVADNGGGGIWLGGVSDATELRIANSIVWGNVDGSLLSSCPGTPTTVEWSLIEGGYAGTGNLDADPRFVLGPYSSHYLSQPAGGQPTTSPAVDAGSQPAFDAGLDVRTTASSSLLDEGTVDMGYHYRPLPTLIIERGTIANALSGHAADADLPWEDDPGTLSDPSLPLLFYRIPATDRDFGVTKSVTFDTVRLAFR